MISAALNEKQWYRDAAQEIIFQRETEQGRRLNEEVMSALRSEHASKVIQRELVSRGVPRDWAGVIVQRAMGVHAREMLTRANEEFDRGLTDTSAIRWAVGVGRGKVMDDPRVSTLISRLEALGFTPPLARFIAVQPEMRTEQMSTASVWIAGGVVAVGFGLWAFVTTGSSDPVHAKALLPIALGIGVVWRGVSTLVQR